MALSPARRLSALTSTLLCQGGDEISKISFAPSLRIDAQLEMLSSKTPQGTVLAGTTSVYIPCSTGPPHDGTRQQDQVGWSEGGPHIVKPAHICHLRAGKARAPDP